VVRTLEVFRRKQPGPKKDFGTPDTPHERHAYGPYVRWWEA
jgi:hypothetical protein